MIKDYFVLAGRGLESRRKRTFLTIIGIFIGIAAVVSLVSLGDGLQNAIDEQFESIGTDLVIILPGGAIAGPLSGEITTAKLTEDDVETISDVKGVELAVGGYAASMRMGFKDETDNVLVRGIPTDSVTTRFMESYAENEIGEGRNPRNGEKYVAVLGYNIAEEKFDKPVRLGSTITLDETEFEVIGIQKKTGSATDGLIRVPKETLREMFGKTDEVSMIIAKTVEGLDPEEVAEDIKKALRKSREVEEGKEDFSAETTKSAIATFTQILAGVQALLVGIASISLLVGGVGIMSTMYTAVTQRAREIGVMKAVGASDRDVLMLFLIESGLLGTAGGLLGVLVGSGICKVVEIVAFYVLGVSLLKVYITPGLIAFALLFSFTVGAISGLLPARHAARLKPVDALRYE